MWKRWISFGAPALIPALLAFAPYSTTVANGDVGSARLVFGDAASVGIRDALPAFSDIDAYETYYQTDDRYDCDDACLRPIYRTLKGAGRMRMLMVGTRVEVLSSRADPDDHRYSICNVRIAQAHWIVLCSGLEKMP